jgi:beta-mannosidase
VFDLIIHLELMNYFSITGRLRLININDGNLRIRGWDWGPKLLTSGPYLPIYLESYDARVDDIHVVTNLSDGLESAELSIGIDLVGISRATHVEVTILDDVGNTVFSDHVKVQGTSTVVSKSITQPKLWWPNGHGVQTLYTTKAQLLSENGSALDTKTTSFGIRKIELIQRPFSNAPGKTFMFSVNNHAIFAQGGNWIPADMMLPNITREKYFEWMELAAHNNLNMIRVWGGGIFETEDFLDACDRYGLLVWHDFAFACGHFPVRAEFLTSVHEEAVVQTKRMRSRACLALLCGGNEDFMLQDMFRPGSYDHHDVKGPFLDKPFEWREIYLGVLPKVVKEVAPGVQYWPSSPWGGDTANDLTVGDVHQWDGKSISIFSRPQAKLTTSQVWHGKQLPYQQYSTLSGRFISEFGMHGFPSMRTVADFITSPEDAHPQSKAIDCHNKGHGAHSRIAKYLAENFRYSTKLEDFVYASQLMQSEAYGYALRDWKRKFGGRGKEECAGAIIWQVSTVLVSC